MFSKDKVSIGRVFYQLLYSTALSTLFAFNHWYLDSLALTSNQISGIQLKISVGLTTNNNKQTHLQENVEKN